MGGVLSYSGLSTKIRAMQVKLTSDEQFNEIVHLTSVPQIIGYLKKTPEYQKRWAGIDEETLHRGEAEKLLQNSIFENYTKIYHFANPQQRKFLALYFKRYEIFLIKECMRSIFDHRDIAIDISVYRDFYRRHSHLDIERMVTCKTIEELMNCIRESEFYTPLSGITGQENKLLFDYGMALDLYYFRLIWKVKDKLFSSNDLAEITKAYGRKFDLLNLQWIQRSKQYYSMAPTDIYSLLIPVNYKLKKQDISQLVEAPNMDEFRHLLSKTYYGVHFDNLNGSTLEQFYNYLLRSTLDREASKDPYSVAIIYSYLYQKAHEVNRLTTAIECVRYGVDPDEALHYIRTA